MANITQVQNNMKYKQAKGSLLAIILFSFVNLFAITFTDSYFLFSAYFTQLFGYMAWMAVEEAAMGLAFVFIFIGALTIVPYLLCFIFAKKHYGWLIGALVLFSIDTVMLLVDSISAISAGDTSFIFDILFHAYALYAIGSAIAAGKKAKKSNEEAVNAPSVNTEISAELTLERRKVVIEREKKFIGCAVMFICFIDGNEAIRVKNGETAEFSIDGNTHELAIMIGDTGRAASIQLREGLGTVNVKVSAKSTFNGVVPVIVNE